MSPKPRNPEQMDEPSALDPMGVPGAPRLIQPRKAGDGIFRGWGPRLL